MKRLLFACALLCASPACAKKAAPSLPAEMSESDARDLQIASLKELVAKMEADAVREALKAKYTLTAKDQVDPKTRKITRSK